MSLIPLDLLMDLLPPAYEEGIVKYYRDSWREGFPISIMHDALLRHLTAFIYKCEDYDPESIDMNIKKLHLGGVIFTAICMYDTIKNHPEMDDRIKIKKDISKVKEYNENKQINRSEYCKYFINKIDDEIVKAAKIKETKEITDIFEANNREIAELKYRIKIMGTILKEQKKENKNLSDDLIFLKRQASCEEDFNIERFSGS